MIDRANRITATLQAQQEPMIDFLSQLVLAESPSTSPEAQAVPMTQLWEALDVLGFEVSLLPGQKSGGQLLARPRDFDAEGGAAPQQLLIGHCDTVWPIGTLKDMPLVREDNILRGPGVYDMKGGLAQMIFALRALKELDLKPAISPLILINSDEEIGSGDSRPVICRLAQEVERAFILEPALGLSGKIKTARKGVGRFDMIIRGRAAHAGLDPEKGISAILGLSYLIQDLHALNDLDNGISVNVGLIEGGLGSNVIAPESRAVVDVRVPAQADAQRLEGLICTLSAPMPGISLEVTGGFGRPPLERTPANRALWSEAQKLAAEMDLTLEEGLAGGGSDGNFTSQYTATLDGLGVVGDGAHARHEFLFIDKMIERTALLSLLLLAP